MAQGDTDVKLRILGENATQAAFREIKTEFESVAAVADKFKGTLAALGIAAGARWAVQLVEDVTRASSALLEMAAKTGSTVEKMSELRQVATITGTSFDLVTDVIVKMNKALAGSGRDDETKGVGAALAAIGLSAEKLKELDPSEQLTAIAKAFNQFADSGGKSAAMTALLGRGSSELSQFLKELETTQSTGLITTTRSAEEGNRLEQAFARIKVQGAEMKRIAIDPLIGPLANLAEQFASAARAAGSLHAAYAAMSLASGSLWNAILGRENDPAAKIKEIDKSIEGLSSTIAKYKANPPTDIFSRLLGGTTLNELEAKLKQAQAQRAIVQAQLNQQKVDIFGPGGPSAAAGGLGDLSQFSVAGKAAAAAKPQIDSLIESLQKELIKTVDLGKQEEIRREIDLGLYGAVIPKSRELALSLAAQIDANKEIVKIEKERVKIQEETFTAKEKLDRFIAETDKEKQSLEDQLDPLASIAQLWRTINKLRDQRGEGFISEELATALEDQTLKNMNKALEDTDDISKKVFRSLESGFEQAILGGKKFGDVLRAVGQDLVKIFLRNAVTEPLGKSAAGLFKNINWGSIFGNLAGAATGADWTVGGSGGTDSQLVAFRATPGERISVQTPEQQGGKGVTIVQNLSFGSDVNRDTLAAWGRQVKMQTMQAVAEARQRGGSYSAAMGR